MPKNEFVDYTEFFYHKNSKPHKKQNAKTFSNPKPHKKGRNWNAIAVLTIVLCFSLTLLLADYFSGGSMLSDFDTQTSTPSSSTYYCIQMGIYADKSTAEYYSSLTRARGGGGYIIHDQDYRVIASVYKNRENAEAVISRMQANDIDCSLYLLTFSPFLDSTLSPEDKATLNTISLFTDYSFTVLYELSNDMDKETVTQSEINAQLYGLREKLTEYQKQADKVEFSPSALTLSASIYATLEILDDLPSSPSSSDIRYAYIAILVQRV